MTTMHDTIHDLISSAEFATDWGLRRVGDYMTGKEVDRLTCAIVSALAAAPTPPVTGSADGLVEPKPQDGRRLENRVAALAEMLAKSDSHFSSKITDLAQQVQALMERVDGHTNDIQRLGFVDGYLIEHTGLLAPTQSEPTAPTRPCKLGDGVCDPTCCPPQPADDGAITRAQQVLEKVWPSKMCAAPDPPQPAADAEKAKAHVIGRRWLEPLVVAEDFDDLVPVIDPEDEAQVQCVMDVLFETRTNLYDSYKATRILTALAEHLAGGGR